MRNERGLFFEVALILTVLICLFYYRAFHANREVGELRGKLHVAERLAERMADRLRSCETELDRKDALR